MPAFAYDSPRQLGQRQSGRSWCDTVRLNHKPPTKSYVWVSRQFTTPGIYKELIGIAVDKKVIGRAAGAEGSVRKAGAILAVASVAVVVGNEICQRLVARGVIDHQLSFGYLSDLFAVPFTVGLTNALGTSRFYWFRPVLFGVLFSLLEFEGVWDPWDMACYWSGAALSYGVMLFVAWADPADT